MRSAAENKAPQMDTWYHSPFPPEYDSASKLFFCEFCLKYMRKASTLRGHVVPFPDSKRTLSPVSCLLCNDRFD